MDVTPIEWTAPSWARSKLYHDQVIKRTKVCAWGKCQTIQKQIKMGKSSRIISTVQFLTENYMVLMENQLSSSGIFSQDLRYCRFSRRSRNICNIETLNLKNLKIEFSSCLPSMTSNGQRKETKKIVFQIQKKVKMSAKRLVLARTLDIPWPWRRKEVVWKSQ